MNREYKPVSQIKSEFPAVKGYILMMPSGSTFILHPDDEEPTSPCCLMGVIDR